MTSFRWRCGLAALLMVAGARALARDGSAVGSDCDMLCRLQAYMATDHMVVLAPSGNAASTVRPHKTVATARRMPAKTLKTAAREAMARKAAVHKTPARRVAVRSAAPPGSPVAASPRRESTPKRAEGAGRNGPLRQAMTAARPEAQDTPKPATAAPAWQGRALIPGSAPTVAAQFTPAER